MPIPFPVINRLEFILKCTVPGKVPSVTRWIFFHPMSRVDVLHLETKLDGLPKENDNGFENFLNCVCVY